MSLIISTSKIKVCEGFYQLIDYAGLSREFGDDLWTELVLDDAVYEEFVYYLEHHTFADREKVAGYALSDLYVWQMDKYNLIREIGKNPTTCNKETMVLNAFRTLVDMKKNPALYVKRIESGRGLDV
ncbi:MAG: hypothetical protein K6G83_09290 [Lachnospiraceae bacterium]|nr:hypothetical protein [Lachnospiraceae bacterium]